MRHETGKGKLGKENWEMFLSVTKELLRRNLSTTSSKTLVCKDLCKDA